VANYLNTLNTAVKLGRDFDVTGKELSQAATNAGWAAANALANGQNPFSAAVNSGLSSIPGAQTAVGIANSLTRGALSSLGLGIGGGSKPQALHTEYAAGSAQWAKPYGSGTDVVFYLQRADGGTTAASGTPASAGTGALPNAVGGSAPSLTGEPTRIGGGVEVARVRADILAGPGLPNSLQSPLNQVATASKLGQATNGAFSTNKGLAGPLTGLTPNLYIEPGGTSQALITMTSTQEAVFSITGSSLAFTQRPVRSLPGSEGFFSKTLRKSFAPDDQEKIGSVESIANALNRAPTAELSAQMAIVTGGIAATDDLVESINYSSVGYTSKSSSAQASKMSPQRFMQRMTR